MNMKVIIIVMGSGWGGGREWGVKVVVGGVVREVLEGGKRIWYVYNYFLVMGFFLLPPREGERVRLMFLMMVGCGSADT